MPGTAKVPSTPSGQEKTASVVVGACVVVVVVAWVVVVVGAAVVLQEALSAETQVPVCGSKMLVPGQLVK